MPQGYSPTSQAKQEGAHPRKSSFGATFAAHHANLKAGAAPAIISAISSTLTTRWFWYSIASCLCWTAWAFTARMGAQQIPATTMQFISAFGFLFVAVAVAKSKKVQLTINSRGSWYALCSGMLLGLGGLALYAAYRTGANTAVVTAATSLYPLATVLLAVLILRERPNRFQTLGIVFATAAIVLFAL